jgi:hypothetical protein
MSVVFVFLQEEDEKAPCKHRVDEESDCGETEPC